MTRTFVKIGGVVRGGVVVKLWPSKLAVFPAESALRIWQEYVVFGVRPDRDCACAVTSDGSSGVDWS